MEIPPCTEGQHSTTDKPPELEKKAAAETDSELAAKIESLNASVPERKPVAPQHVPTPPPPQAESEDDDPSLEIPDGKACRRRGCKAEYSKGASREGESCVFHPGVPIFHEGSKGYSCCKRRVMEFDQFMKLEGCATKDRHMFIGSGKDKAAKGSAGGEEVLETVRYARPSFPLLGTAPKCLIRRINSKYTGTTSTRPLPPSSRPSSSRRSSRTSRPSSSATTRSTSTS